MQTCRYIIVLLQTNDHLLELIIVDAEVRRVDAEQLERNICIYCCIVKVRRVKWTLPPFCVVPLVEFFLHLLVPLVDEGGCHMSHPGLFPILLIKMDQILKINVVVFMYLNIQCVLHLHLVICYINANKIKTAVDK